jgi:cytidylate kinase/CBS domain-containing protein
MPIISISQGSHAGSRKLAEALHQRLGYKVVTLQDALSAAKRYGISEEAMYRGLDMPANFFERFGRRKERYILAMQATLGELMADGDGIYCGLAGQFVFQGLCGVFKVRLVAPMDYRIQSVMSNLKLSHEEATSYIERADERRATWGRQMFNADLNDPDLYDLVVNLEHMSIDTAADMITGIIKRTEFPEDCRRQYQAFALQQKVRAALRFNSPYDADGVTIAADDGVVTLAGGRVFDELQEEIVDFVSRIRGVTKVVTSSGEVASVDSSFDLDVGLSTRDTTARDVMLPPTSYPHCRLSCTIREGIVAISASAVKLDDTHIMLPRYLLVLDDEGDELHGIVSRRELLKGLIPHLHEDKETADQIRKLVPFGGHTPSDLAIRWTSLFSAAALEASSHSIASIMVPIRGTVQVNDNLSTVISTMLHHGVDLVPVLDGQRVAGVVLMTNIFDIVAQYIMEHGGGGTGEPRS